MILKQRETLRTSTCYRCKTKIPCKTVARVEKNRGTHFCPKCVGFFASRYSSLKIILPLTEEEQKWKDDYDLVLESWRRPVHNSFCETPENNL